MAEAVRQRPMEYASPRPLILGICFIWGIGVGFGLNFFRPPEPAEQRQPATSQPETAARPVPSEIERRRQDIPSLAEVEPAPVQAPNFKPTIEDVNVEPPAAIMTTEGGLTARTALPLGARPSQPPVRPPQPPPSLAPPPIPDLMP